MQISLPPACLFIRYEVLLMRKIKLSIIVPCYNVEKYLKRCLDSLLSQSMEGIEIICINDGSPDNCLSILKSYRESFGDRLIIIDKENEGVWKGRMEGIKIARGEYIGFLDPDDYVHRDFAKKLYLAAKKERADIACCGFYRVEAETLRVYSREMRGFPYDSFNIQSDSGLLLQVNPAIWNKIFRAGILKNMHTLKHIPKALDDMVFSQLIYMDSRVIAFIPDSLVYYTVRRDSIISTISPEYVPRIYASVRELRGIFSKRKPHMLPYLDAEAFLHLGISLMYRLYLTDSGFRPILDRNTAFLNRHFPLWRNNKYISLPYVLRHRGANLKLLIVRTVYSLRLFPAFLTLYTGMIRRLKRDIKW